MKACLATIAAAFLVVASATVQAQHGAPATEANPQGHRLYGAEAVDSYNQMVQLHFQVVQQAAAVYRTCMELQLAIAQKSSTPTANCAMPPFSPIPPLQWLETTPERKL